MWYLSRGLGQDIEKWSYPVTQHFFWEFVTVESQGPSIIAASSKENVEIPNAHPCGLVK